MATTLNRIRRIGHRDSVAVLCQGRECIPKEAQRHNTDDCRMQNVHPSIIATPVALVATELDDRLTADAGWLLIRLASRETELAREFPLHVVTEWLGNTPQIALQHYLRVTDENFERATQSAPEGGAKSGAQVAQNAVQQAHAANRTDWQETTKAPDKQGLRRNRATPGGVVPEVESGGDRIRTTAVFLGNSHILTTGAAKSSAPDAAN